MATNGLNVQLSVSGVAIHPSIRGPVYVPSRKFYNAAYFHDDRYRHEIANHYRDFKMRPRLRRRKRRVFMCSYGKPTVPAIRREMPWEYLPELPMAVLELPRFDKEYTPSGRQRRLCDEKRHDIICNDTLKRIQKAAEGNDTETLQHYARRQLNRFQGFEPRTERRTRKTANVYASLGKCEKWHNAVNDLQQEPSKSTCRRRSLGKLESVEGHHQQQQQQQQRRRRQAAQVQQQEFPFANDCGVIRPHQKSKRNFVSEPESTRADRSKSDRVNTLTYYLQLATDYYEQGFLSNINYLKNVGERNQLRRKQQQTLRQLTTTATAATSKCTTIECTSASSLNRCERCISANAIQDESVDGNNSGVCNPILKIIAQKRSFRIYRYNEKQREHPDSVYSAHWPIRVQIKPVDSSSSATALTQTAKGTGNDNGNSKSSKIPSQPTPENRSNTTASQDCCYSMNEYLSGNLQLQQAPNRNYHQLTSFHHNYPAREDLLIDTLIGNLQQLEIDEHPIHLPRITLSDYTHRYPTEYTSGHSSSPTPLDVDTTLLSGKRCFNSIVLRRQESVDLSLTSLDIPQEASNYHSESRPPY